MKVPSWLRLLLLSPSVLAVAVATRLLLMANLDPMVAMKIATTGGLVGTLVGTIVPLLPPFLPLFVVWLVIARRWFLAFMAAMSTALVSPAKTGALEGWRHIYQRGWAFFSDQFSQPGLWAVATLSMIAAFAASPAALRWVRKDDMVKTVDEKVRRFESETVHTFVPDERYNADTGEHEIVGFKPIDYEEASPQQRRFWRAAIRSAYRDQENWRRWRNAGLRVVYAVAVAAAAVLFVGAVSQFYVIPAAGADPAFIARRPWIPPEVLTTKAGRQEVGYVLATADKWFTVLAEKDRTIHYLAADDVTRRSVCTLEPASASNTGPLVRFRGVTGPSSKPCPVPR